MIAPVTPKTTKNANDKAKLYRNIFTSKIEKDQLASSKKGNHSVDFEYVRDSLVHTRIHIFNSKSKSKDKGADKPGSKVKIFKKAEPKHTLSPKKVKSPSPAKKDIVHDFNVMEMSY